MPLLNISTTDAITRWPAHLPLCALTSESQGRWSTHSLLASPDAPIIIPQSDPDPLARLAHHLQSTACSSAASHDPNPGPFGPGWLIALSYELGHALEPTTRPAHFTTDNPWPFSIVLWRCPWLLKRSSPHGPWSLTGTPNPAADEILRALTSTSPPPPSAHISNLRHQTTAADFQRAVRRAVEYIHAGDIFQANLSHRLLADFSGSPRALFASMLIAAQPWYAAFLELESPDTRRAVISASPELLLQFEPQARSLITRPIKGTRPASSGRHSLENSPKDHAELNMIVDLMRNDLGRVAEPGSVRVVDPRAIEHHAHNADHAPPDAGILHTTATIHARLRDNLSFIDALRAVFPGGSITGAPKVRAMQIIAELERRPRGLYTGSIGYISDHGHAVLNIAIRTAVVASDQLSYDIGAGIVADSDPHAEYLETLDKARILLDLAPSHEHT